MTNNELFFFTGKCLSLDEHPELAEDIIKQCQSDSTDWQKFVGLCSNHLILPLVYVKFQTHGILEHLPEELVQHLKQIFDLNVTRNNQILQQIREITDTLNKHNIEPLFLKGSANLLDGLYSNIGERILSDVDFLVPEKDYLLSAKLLENVGYSVLEPFFGDAGEKTHYPRLCHPDFVSIIEIHRIPVKKNYEAWFNTNTIETEKKTIPSLPGCHVSSDKHKIIHNFIHSQLSDEGYLYGIVSFKDLYDLYLLSKRADLLHSLEEIKSKKRAIAYFAFAKMALGLNESFFSGSNLNYWILKKKHSLNLSSRIFYFTFRHTIFISQRIFSGYIGQFFEAFYSREMRKSIFKRLSNIQWYKEHINFYKRFLSN